MSPGSAGPLLTLQVPLRVLSRDGPPLQSHLAQVCPWSRAKGRPRPDSQHCKPERQTWVGDSHPHCTRSASPLAPPASQPIAHIPDLLPRLLSALRPPVHRQPLRLSSLPAPGHPASPSGQTYSSPALGLSSCSPAASMDPPPPRVQTPGPTQPLCLLSLSGAPSPAADDPSASCAHRRESRVAGRPAAARPCAQRGARARAAGPCSHITYTRVHTSHTYTHVHTSAWAAICEASHPFKLHSRWSVSCMWEQAELNDPGRHF